MQRPKQTMALLFSVLFLLFPVSCGGKDKFQSFEEMKTVMGKDGYVFAGKFGDKWPATVQESRDGKDGITFDAPHHGKMAYKKYKGYDFRLFLLKSDGGEDFAIVFKKKRG